jgi:hypothetical protein
MAVVYFFDSCLTQTWISLHGDESIFHDGVDIDA